jgi:uncharacterized protein YigA (DUF484 family)
MATKRMTNDDLVHQIRQHRENSIRICAARSAREIASRLPKKMARLFDLEVLTLIIETEFRNGLN